MANDKQIEKAFNVSIGDCVAISNNILSYLSKIRANKTQEAQKQKTIICAAMMTGYHNGFDVSQYLLRNKFKINPRITKKALAIRTTWENDWKQAERSNNENEEKIDAEAIAQVRLCFDLGDMKIQRQRVSDVVIEMIDKLWNDTTIPEPSHRRRVWHKDYGSHTRSWQVLSDVETYSLLKNDPVYNHIFTRNIRVPSIAFVRKQKHWFIKRDKASQYWDCKKHFNAKQFLKHLIRIYKLYCRCGQQCRNFRCTCGQFISEDDEMLQIENEDDNNNRNECNCRCNCNYCNHCPFYNDINNDLQYLSIFLTENYCTTEWTDGDEVDFGEWMPYCCIMRDTTSFVRDAVPGARGEEFKCPLTAANNNGRRIRNCRDLDRNINGFVLPCGIDSIQTKINESKYCPSANIPPDILITYDQYDDNFDTRTTTKLTREQQWGDFVDEAMTYLKSKFALHEWQRKAQKYAFNHMTNMVDIHLPETSILFVVDWAQNVLVLSKVMSMDMYHNRPEVAWLCVVEYKTCNHDSGYQIKRTSHHIISDYGKHDVAASFQGLRRIVKDRIAMYRNNGNTIDIIHLWSDGAPNHFGTTPFVRCTVLIGHENNCRLFMNFFPSYHGKADSDGEISVGKGVYMRCVKASKINWGSTRKYRSNDPNRRAKMIRDVLNDEFAKMNANDPNGIQRYAYTLGTHYIDQVDSPFITINRFTHHKQFYAEPNDRNCVKYRFLSCGCTECMTGNVNECLNKDIVGRVWKKWNFANKLIRGESDFQYRPLRRKGFR